MINLETEKLTYLAAQFRSAIVSILERDPKALDTSFEYFPRGSCGDASDLLAKYFQDHECGNFDYVWGKLGEQSHAWLEREGLIIDVTADQFGGQDSGVIVTRDHRWHSQFSDVSRHIADFDLSDLYDSGSRDRLRHLYEVIVEEIRVESE